MQKTKAVIEFGTNKWRVVANNLSGETVLYKDHPSSKNITNSKIGEDYLFACMSDFSDELKKHGLNIANNSEVRVIATESFRADKNAENIVEKIKQKMGVEIEIISAKREAELSAKAMVSENSQKNILIIDMGGGSTDIALYSAEENKIVGTVSLIGSKFLLENINQNYNNKDKVFKLEEENIREKIEDFKEKSSYDLYAHNLDIITNTSAIMKIVSVEDKQKKVMPLDMEGKEKKALNLMISMEKVFHMNQEEVFELGYSKYKAASQTITAAFILKETLAALDLNKNQMIGFSLKGPKDGLLIEMFAQDEVKKMSLSQEIFSRNRLSR